MKLLSLSLIIILASYADAAYKIVCYFESWGVYRTGNGKFDVNNIDPKLCTHIIYSFVSLTPDGKIKELGASEKGMINRLKALRNKNKKLKVMVAIGGADASKSTFEKVINSASLRSKFSDNIVTFIKKYGLNGLDLDWEYPTNKATFADLLKILRPKMDKYGYELSAAVAAGYSSIDKAYDVPALGKYLHFINVMAYDMHGDWDSPKITGENAPLYAGPADKNDHQRKMNVDYAIKYWIKKGAPKNKLILGMGTYGRSFTLKSSSSNGVGAPSSGPGKKGPYTGTTGYLGYNEICEGIKAGKWKEHSNTKQKAVYAVSGDQWVGYDNVATITTKAQYVRKNRLGGAMIWALGTDDFKNRCGHGKFPLLSAIKKTLK